MRQLIRNRRITGILLVLLSIASCGAFAQEMPDMWAKDVSQNAGQHPDSTWFKNAKFGIFIHWGLYSEAANIWQGKDYFGSGEWLMNRGKIPVKDYEKLASRFNPSKFDGDAWAQFIHDSGAKYVVITAKHHEGFAMFKSKVSPFNIVDATPYGKDPMASLAQACRKRDVQFGFYYSQYLDWHEPNGGGNSWDFDPAKKDVKKYYAEKSMPQIRELSTNYGPLGILWFDMPGGLTQDETRAFVGEVRKLQPNALISSRVGRGFGDFSDLGDSELPPQPGEGVWEALFTHTDSWGYQKYDESFKTPREVVRLLVSTAARGGNLILNVGPDGQGNIPPKSIEYLREVGKWLAKNGDAVYGTTASPFPDQPWGVATSKPGHLYLHVLDRPRNNEIYVPRFEGQVRRVTALGSTVPLVASKKQDGALTIQLPARLADSYDTVLDVQYAGTLKQSWDDAPAVVSRQFDSFSLDAANAVVANGAKIQSKTHSRYFGNWKHDTVVTDQSAPEDTATFKTRFLEPGDYRMILEYAAPAESKDREGIVQVNGNSYRFQSLFTLTYNSHQPIMFVRHTIGVVSINKAGEIPVTIHPLEKGAPLFWLRRVIFEPVR